MNNFSERINKVFGKSEYPPKYSKSSYLFKNLKGPYVIAITKDKNLNEVYYLGHLPFIENRDISWIEKDIYDLLDKKYGIVNSFDVDPNDFDKFGLKLPENTIWMNIEKSDVLNLLRNNQEFIKTHKDWY